MRFFLSLLLSVFSFTLVAQNIVTEPAPVEHRIEKLKKIGNNKVTMDTINLSSTRWSPIFAPNDTVVYYAYPNGGWLYGTNTSANNLSMVAQGFRNDSSALVGVSEILIWFCAKDYSSLDTNSKLKIDIYEMDDNVAGNTNGSGGMVNDSKGPTNSLFTHQYKVADVDTNLQTFNVISLGSVLPIYGTDFAVGVDFSTVKTYGDEVGILCDKKNDANNLDYAFHYAGVLGQWVVSDWLFSAAQGGSGGLDNSMGIFVVVDRDYVGIDDDQFFNGMQLEQSHPNPANSVVVFDYRLERRFDNVQFEIFDARGRVIHTTNLNSFTGLNSYQLNVSDWEIGVYYYSLITDGQRLTKKMIIQ